MMQLSQYPYQPVGGINGEDLEDSIGDNEVVDARNLLFERKQFVTRPGVVGQTVGTITGSIDFGKTFRAEFLPFTLIIDSDLKLYKLTSPTTAVQITGPAIVPAFIPFYYAEVVNGIVLIAGYNGGMLRWDTSTTVYTVISAGNYIYVTSHLTRAVGAYKLDGSSGDSRRLGWSQSGDETLWSGGDSGTDNLIDAPDDITGLSVLHNVLVIIRRTGIHLGTPTGISTPVYKFDIWGRQVPGCNYSSTLDTYNNTIYYVSQDDVYSFDLQQISPIGGKIRRELFTYLKNGAYYRGFISVISSPEPRARYHLVPMMYTDPGGMRPNELPHFTYDIQDRIWSRHTYGFEIRGGFYYQQIFDTTPTLFQGKKVYLWNPALNCETASFLQSKQITIGAEEINTVVRRVLVKCKDYGQYDISITGRCNENSVVVENTATETVGTVVADQRLKRFWFNFEGLAGQDFQLDLNIPAGVKFAGNYLGMRFGGAGEFKGDARG